MTDLERDNKMQSTVWEVPPGAGGWDGPIDPNEPKPAWLKELEAEYDDAPPPPVDSEYDDEVGDEPDPALVEAARKLDDHKATPDEIAEARETLLDSVGGFDEQYVDTEVPTDKAAYQQMIADAVRQGMTPLSEYAQPGEVDDAVAHHSAVEAVASEIAIQTAAKRALGIPGFADESGPSGPRSPEERAAIQAVRAAMLRQRGVEPADLMGAPLGDDFFDEAIAEDDAAMDEQLGLPKGTTAASFDAGGLDD